MTTPRHRAPPAPRRPRTPAVLAVAACVLGTTALIAAADAVAPEAHASPAAVTPAPTRGLPQMPGPLEIPVIGVPSVIDPTPSEAPQATRSSRTTMRTPERSWAAEGEMVAITTPSGPTPTPVVTEPAPTETATPTIEPTPTVPVEAASPPTSTETPAPTDTPAAPPVATESEEPMPEPTEASPTTATETSERTRRRDRRR